MEFIRELTNLIEAKYPILYLTTIEEERLENIILKNIFKRHFFSWDFSDGYKNYQGYDPTNIESDNSYVEGWLSLCTYENYGQRNPLEALNLIDFIEIPSIFLLKDFDRFLTDTSISRKLKNLYKRLTYQPKTIIIISSEVNIPRELRDLVTVIQFNLPVESEIESQLKGLIKSANLRIETQLIKNLTKACQGLSMENIRRVVEKIIATYKTIDENSVKVIWNEKKQIISQTEILEYWETDEKIQNIGGIDNLKDWLKKRTNSFGIEALKYGLPTPRGLLLVGIQGTGKSLTAKAIATEWQLPLLKLDVGKLFGGIIGESESRLRQMIQISETLSPCVLWIDEIDKAFNNSPNKGDSGTSNRVLGTFISWLSEKNKPVFVVATANNVEILPLEIIRKGRFDEIFFLDLPRKNEREQIFKIHLQEFRPKTWESFNYIQLAELSESFSGAEIRQSIIDAMYYAFDESREFTTDDICFALNELIPLSQLNTIQMKNLQSWALSGRIRLASSKNF
jgi:SpoVK/Ycf46/Vps4 family AAA+-type ATPase